MPAPKGNKYAIGNKGGRPAFFKSPEDLAKKVDEYFEWIKGEEKEKTANVYNESTGLSELKTFKYWHREPEPPTRTGLVLYLGFHSLASFDQYEKMSEEFLVVIQRAKIRVANSYERRLDDRNKARGAVFVLNNMGWNSKTEITYLGKDGKPVDPPTQMVITNVMPNTQKES